MSMDSALVQAHRLVSKIPGVSYIVYPRTDGGPTTAIVPTKIGDIRIRFKWGLNQIQVVCNTTTSETFSTDFNHCVPEFGEDILRKLHTQVDRLTQIKRDFGFTTNIDPYWNEDNIRNAPRHLLCDPPGIYQGDPPPPTAPYFSIETGGLSQKQMHNFEKLLYRARIPRSISVVLDKKLIEQNVTKFHVWNLVLNVTNFTSYAVQPMDIRVSKDTIDCAREAFIATLNKQLAHDNHLLSLATELNRIFHPQTTKVQEQRLPEQAILA